MGVLLLTALITAAVPQAQPVQQAPADPQTPAVVAPERLPQGGAALRGLLTPDPNAPPVIDIALRLVRTAQGGSSIARSAVRGDETAVVYAGLGPCVVGASAEDPAEENSMAWRTRGHVRSIERGIAVADVEWQRVEYLPAGIAAGPRVRTTITLPLGERVAVDFADVSGSPCRADGLIFEIGVAPDHGWRLTMSGEGRRSSAGAAAGGAGGGGRAGAGVGNRAAPEELAARADRRLRAEENVRAAPVVDRAMPPRQYDVDLWLVPETSNSSTPPLAQRMSQVVGGTGGRFDFPPITVESPGNGPVVVDISALVIPVDGKRLIVAITREVTPAGGASPVSTGWLKAVSLPEAGDVLSFEIPAQDGTGAASGPRQGYGLRLRIGQR